jgi:hypothetical protein
MTRENLLDDLADLDAHLDRRVQIVRVVVAPDGTVLGRIYRGSFSMPVDWQPPSLEHLIATSKKRRTDD